MLNINIVCFFSALLIVLIKFYLEFLMEKDIRKGIHVEKENYKILGITKIIIKDIFVKIKGGKNCEK